MGLSALAWSPDGAVLACGLEDGGVALWPARSAFCFRLLRTKGGRAKLPQTMGSVLPLLLVVSTMGGSRRSYLKLCVLFYWSLELY